MTKKIISAGDKLKAFALYTMACDHYLKAREFERAASVIVGVGDSNDYYNDSISDGIYGYETPMAFDRVLKNAQVTVKPAPKKKAKRT